MVLKGKLHVMQGDITRCRVDAIVNAANTSLLGGGGVDGAIHRAAGPMLLAACKTIGGCPTGEARITRGYRLFAPYVIHTVGPVYHGNEQDAFLLSACYRSSLSLAALNKLKTIAFPAISCGVYGYPMEKACPIAVDAVIEFLDSHPEMDAVFFVLFSAVAETVYCNYLNEKRRI